MSKNKIIHRLHNLGIEELKSVTSLNELNGDYINLECRWPNGVTGKILDASKKYYGTQIEQPGSDRCMALPRTKIKSQFLHTVAAAAKPNSSCGSNYSLIGHVGLSPLFEDVEVGFRIATAELGTG